MDIFLVSVKKNDSGGGLEAARNERGIGRGGRCSACMLPGFS